MDTVKMTKMSPEIEKFEELWNYQQGALFLKQDMIYSLRKNLAEYFYKAGQAEMSRLLDEKDKQLTDLQREFKIHKEACDKFIAGLNVEESLKPHSTK